MEGEFPLSRPGVNRGGSGIIRQLIAQQSHTNRRQASLRGNAKPGGGSRPMAHCATLVCRGGLCWNSHGPASAVYHPRPIGTTANPAVRRATSGPAGRRFLLGYDFLWRVPPAGRLRPLVFQPVRRMPESRSQLFRRRVSSRWVTAAGGRAPFKYLGVAGGTAPSPVWRGRQPRRHLGAPRSLYPAVGGGGGRAIIVFFGPTNPRYLILPWVRVPHLAFRHVLGQMARRIRGRLGTGSRGTPFISRDLRSIPNATAANVLSGRRTGW